MRRNQESFSLPMISSSDDFSMFRDSQEVDFDFERLTQPAMEGRMTRSRSAIKIDTLNNSPTTTSSSFSAPTIETEEEKSTVMGTPSGWRTTKMNTDFLGTDCYFHVTIRSKGEQETNFLPENLYSSIKYHIGHHISGSFIKKHKVDHLVVRLKVVDPTTQLEIKQNNKPIVKGVTESHCSFANKHGKGSGKRKSTMTAAAAATSIPTFTDNSEIGTSMKIQLTSCSYHHARAKFAVMASYYRDEKDVEPVMVVISNPFLCFARKPQTKKFSDNASVASSVESNSDLSSLDDSSNSAPSPRLTGSKRKRNNNNNNNNNNRSFKVEETVVDGVYVDDGLLDTVRVDRKVVEAYKEMEAKKARHVQLAQTQYPSHSDNFRQFVAKLEDLFESFPSTNEAELTEASSLVVRKLLQLTDNDEQSYMDQKLYMHAQSSDTTATTATTTTDYQGQLPSLQSSGMTSFPSSASYSNLLALTEQQFSPFDVTEQLASDDMSAISTTHQLIYGLSSGMTDV